eukprot:1297220-Rhodomonas_salina.1
MPLQKDSGGSTEASLEPDAHAGGQAATLLPHLQCRPHRPGGRIPLFPTPDPNSDFLSSQPETLIRNPHAQPSTTAPITQCESECSSLNPWHPPVRAVREAWC